MDLVQRKVSEDKAAFSFLEEYYDIGKVDLEEEVKYELKEIEGMEMVMTVYAPKAFRALVGKDKEMMNPYESLDPLVNE